MNKGDSSLALGMTSQMWVESGSSGDLLVQIAAAPSLLNSTAVIPNGAERNEESPHLFHFFSWLPRHSTSGLFAFIFWNYLRTGPVGNRSNIVQLNMRNITNKV